jgi:transcriptional regulator with XRE-family HTH domain
MMTYARDSSRVKARREELGLQLGELAALVCRSAASVSMIEGGFVPSHERRCQIADALNTTAEELWPDEYRKATS